MSDAGCSMLGAGAWGWPREMLWGGMWEGGSCLGTHVRIKDFKIKKKIACKRESIIMLLFSHSAVSDSLVTSQWACQAPLSMGLSRQGFWGELPFPLQGIFWPRDWTRVFCIGRQILYHWATWGAWCYNLCLVTFPWLITLSFLKAGTTRLFAFDF